MACIPIVKDILDEKHPYVYLDDTATHARSIMRETGVRILPVIDPDYRVRGVLGRAEVLGITATRSNLLVRNLMSPPLIVLDVEDELHESVRRMLSIDEWYAPVASGDKYAGVAGLDGFLALYLKKAPGRLEEVRVSEAMSRNVVYVQPEDHVGRVWMKMLKHRYAGLPVIDNKGRVLGIITQIDLIRRGFTRPVLESESPPKRGPSAREIMVASPIILGPDASLLEAVRLMLDRDIGRIIICGPDRRLLGILDREDAARILLE